MLNTCCPLHVLRHRRKKVNATQEDLINILFLDLLFRWFFFDPAVYWLDLWTGLDDARVGYILEAASASWYTLKPVSGFVTGFGFSLVGVG
jgi:hypothetical protein